MGFFHIFSNRKGSMIINSNRLRPLSHLLHSKIKIRSNEDNLNFNNCKFFPIMYIKTFVSKFGRILKKVLIELSFEDVNFSINSNFSKFSDLFQKEYNKIQSDFRYPVNFSIIPNETDDWLIDINCISDISSPNKVLELEVSIKFNNLVNMMNMIDIIDINNIS